MLLCLFGTAVWACGPFFPQQLLWDRVAALRSNPQNLFAWEASHLVVPDDHLRAVEGGDAATVVDGAPAEQAAVLAAMAAAANGDAAYGLGGGLPEGLRLYRAAAVDYRAGDNIAAAITRFRAVLALEPAERGDYAVPASFMLGESLAQQRAACPDCDISALRSAAAQAFAGTRALVRAGAPDPQGLAVASYGEEARLWLRSSLQAAACDWSSTADGDTIVDAQACIAALPAGDLRQAIGLYAEQAARGSDIGALSLRYLAGHVFETPAQVDALIADPLAQRLLVAYAIGRIGDLYTHDEATGKSGTRTPPVVVALVDAIARRGVNNVTGADRLAALAYRAGRYDLAGQLAQRAPGSLSSWVKAKLALRKGDLAAADVAYADAMKAFPANDDPRASMQADNGELIEGERGVLALARGEYVQAMERMFDAAGKEARSGRVVDEDSPGGIGYAEDASYIGERVLTVDELKRFVDEHAPASAPVTPHDDETEVPPADSLRWLLARRLMRMGRFDEAYAYFPDMTNNHAHEVDLRAMAHAYATAMHDADHAWTALRRARAAYAAAVIAREHGMELLGFEQDPDYFSRGGGYGRDYYSVKAAGEYVTAGEQERFGASNAQPDFRFHYRYVAADLAVRAADGVPARSQAFAALMCQASDWMIEGPPDYNDEDRAASADAPAHVSERWKRLQAYYRRYVAQGAHVSWAENWGQDCPKPDFDAAARMQHAQRVAAFKHLARTWRIPGIGLGVLVIVAFAALFVRRRRRRNTG